MLRIFVFFFFFSCYYFWGRGVLTPRETGDGMHRSAQDTTGGEHIKQSTALTNQQIVYRYETLVIVENNIIGPTSAVTSRGERGESGTEREGGSTSTMLHDSESISV